jgi:ribosomal protein S8
MALIKTAFRGEFRNLLAILRLAILDGRTLVTFAKKKYRYLFIMKTLKHEGFIESFEERGEFLLVRLKQAYWTSCSRPASAFTEISSLVRLHRKDTMNARDLVKLQRLRGQAQTHFVSTDKGILVGSEAAKHHAGGIPLFRIG